MQIIDSFIRILNILYLIIIEIIISVLIFFSVLFFPLWICWVLIIIWPLILIVIIMILIIYQYKRIEWKFKIIGMSIKQSQCILWFLSIGLLLPYIYFLFNNFIKPDSSTYSLIFLYYPIEAILFALLIWLVLLIFNGIKKIISGFLQKGINNH